MKTPCIDLMLTNFPKGFTNYMAVETELPDCHKMTRTVMKSHDKKQKPKIICYRKNKFFPLTSF